MTIYDQSPIGNHLGIEQGMPYLSGPRAAHDHAVDFNDTEHSRALLAGRPVCVKLTNKPNTAGARGELSQARAMRLVPLAHLHARTPRGGASECRADEQPRSRGRVGRRSRIVALTGLGLPYLGMVGTRRTSWGRGGPRAGARRQPFNHSLMGG